MCNTSRIHGGVTAKGRDEESDRGEIDAKDGLLIWCKE
jgi:hypothetical protein